MKNIFVVFHNSNYAQNFGNLIASLDPEFRVFYFYLTKNHDAYNDLERVEGIDLTVKKNIINVFNINPNLVVCLDFYSPFEVFFLYISKRKKIPTLLFPHALLHPTKSYKGFFFRRIIMVKKKFRIFVKNIRILFFTKEKIGGKYFLYFFRYYFIPPRERGIISNIQVPENVFFYNEEEEKYFSRIFKENKYRKYFIGHIEPTFYKKELFLNKIDFVYFSQPFEEDFGPYSQFSRERKKTLFMLLQLKAIDPDFVIVIKIHPRENIKKFENLKKKGILVIKEANNKELINKSKIVLGHFSNILIYSILYKKTLIILPPIQEDDPLKIYELRNVYVFDDFNWISKMKINNIQKYKNEPHIQKFLAYYGVEKKETNTDIIRFMREMLNEY